MAKPKNHGKEWTSKDLSDLKKMAKANKATTTIAKNLGRTEASIRSKANEKKITLGSPN